MNGAESAPRPLAPQSGERVGVRGGATLRDFIAGASRSTSRSPSSGPSGHLLPAKRGEGIRLSFSKHKPSKEGMNACL